MNERERDEERVEGIPTVDMVAGRKRLPDEGDPKTNIPQDCNTRAAYLVLGAARAASEAALSNQALEANRPN